MTVLDASLLIDATVGLPAGRPWTGYLSRQRLAAPDCVVAEFGRYLRRHMIAGELADTDADAAIRAFAALRVVLYPIRPLLDAALALRASFTFDDALYVTLARALAVPLASTDKRLNRAAAALGLTIAQP